MKRIIICLSIATFSIMGMSAQEKFEKINSVENQNNLRVYKQQQEQELKTTIREQTENYIKDAAKRMEAQKTQVQNELEARREQLTNRPAGMVPYTGPALMY